MRCVRYAEIDWATHKPKGVVSEPLQPGKPVLQVRDMKKYYEIRDNSLAALFSGASVRYVKANEKLDFEAREAETVAIVGESGCGKSTFAKVLMGLESCDRRRGAGQWRRCRQAAGQEAPAGPDLEPADRLPESRSRR